MDSLSPDLRAWVKAMVAQYAMPSEKYLVDECLKEYGDNGVAIAKSTMETTMASFPTYPDAPTLSGKPAHNERVIIRKLIHNIGIRIWGPDRLLAIYAFLFDFVDSHGKYIPIPPGLTVYLLGVSSSDPQLFSMKKSLQLADLHGTVDPLDPDDETFIIGEGARLRIQCPDGTNHFINIPLRRPQEGGNTIETPSFW